MSNIWILNYGNGLYSKKTEIIRMLMVKRNLISLPLENETTRNTFINMKRGDEIIVFINSNPRLYGTISDCYIYDIPNIGTCRAFHKIATTNYDARKNSYIKSRLEAISGSCLVDTSEESDIRNNLLLPYFIQKSLTKDFATKKTATKNIASTKKTTNNARKATKKKHTIHRMVYNCNPFDGRKLPWPESQRARDDALASWRRLPGCAFTRK